MPRAIFLVPMEGTGTREDPRRARYARAAGVVSHGGMDYDEDTMLVMFDADAATLTLIGADPECTLLATQNNIDQTLGAAATAARGLIEARGIPADWVTSTDTRRSVIRGLAGMVQFSRRMEGALGENFRQRLVRHGVTLDTVWPDLPAAFRTELVSVARSAGWTQDAIPDLSAMPLRRILKALGNRYERAPISLGGVPI